MNPDGIEKAGLSKGQYQEMTHDKGITKPETQSISPFGIGYSSLFRHSTFELRYFYLD
jgi:hypothetical protein